MKEVRRTYGFEAEVINTRLRVIKSSQNSGAAIVVDPASTYEPLSSVWEGSDAELLEAMFKFYATIPPEPILDAT